MQSVLCTRSAGLSQFQSRGTLLPFVEIEYVSIIVGEPTLVPIPLSRRLSFRVQYVPVREDIGTWTTRYRAIPSKSTIGGRFQPSTGISIVDGRLREREEEGEEENGEKREIPDLPWFPSRSVTPGRFFTGGLPSPRARR
ncbi:hypothetical protein GW17_00038832 [Ensete ventricosum]|nr:hypothetical protein GW17_00038832 [Ensete ventricosum]